MNKNWSKRRRVKALYNYAIFVLWTIAMTGLYLKKTVWSVDQSLHEPVELTEDLTKKLKAAQK